MKSTQNLPVRLKELRKKNQFSQEYVAEQLNISRQAISHWENGKAYPDIDNLVLLAELFSISVDELLQDEEIAYTKNNVITTTENYKILETIGLAIIVVLSANVPFWGIPIAILVAVWNFRTKRHYKLIYLICLVCVWISIYELFVVYGHFNTSYGRSFIFLQ